MLIALLLVGFDFLSDPVDSAWAQTPEQKLRDVEQQLQRSKQQQDELTKKADTLANELQNLRGNEVQAAASAQAHETALTQLEGDLAKLNAQEKAKSAELEQRRSEEAQLLLTLARLARDPPESLALSPQPPVDSLRGGMLLGRAVPPIEARARALGTEIAQLENLRLRISKAQAQHRTEREGLARERTRIGTLISRKQDLQQQAQQGTAQSEQKQATLVAQASDLKDLISRLEKARQDRERAAAKAAAAAQAAASRHTATNQSEGVMTVTAPSPVAFDPARPRNIRPMGQAKGHMDVPASGIVTARYGDPEPAGSAKGMTFETRPGAQVIAPFDGKVLYAGAFKGYGQILIIGHGDGYHSLLAGLDRVDQTAGQWLVAGEPVGVMGQGDRKPRLYFELRLNGQPINPLPWLAIRSEKVNG